MLSARIVPTSPVETEFADMRAAYDALADEMKAQLEGLDWPIPEGRLLLRDLIEHATQSQFVYRHAWRVGDFLIWDNRATMHRARPFEDTKHRRELRRVTTLDVTEPEAVARSS